MTSYIPLPKAEKPFLAKQLTYWYTPLMCISISKLIIWQTDAPTAPHHIFMCLTDIEYEEMLKLLNLDSLFCGMASRGII